MEDELRDPPTSDSLAHPSATGLRRTVPRWKWLVVLAIAVAMLSATERTHRALAGSLTELRADWLALACVVCLAYRPANACGWAFALRLLGRPLPTLRAIRLWLASESLRWIPGSIWAYGSRALRAVDQGVPRPVAAQSLALELALTIVSWGLVACVGFGTLLSSASRPALAGNVDLVRIAVGVSVLGSLALAARFWLRRQGERTPNARAYLEGLRLLARRSIGWRASLGLVVFYVAMNALNGVAFFFVLHATSGGHAVPLVAAISANALAWLIGFSAFLFSGGIVVREVALALLLAPWVPLEVGLVAAFTWRLVQIAVEVVWLLPIAGLPARRGAT